MEIKTLDFDENKYTTFENTDYKIKRLGQLEFKRGYLDIGDYYFLLINKSCKKFINHIGKDQFLTWNTRKNIFNGLCKIGSGLNEEAISDMMNNNKIHGFFFINKLFLSNELCLNVVTNVLCNSNICLVFGDGELLCTLQ